MANHTNWLNISSQSGSSGQTILTLSANKNLSTNYKTAEITAYNPVYNVSAKTYVTIEAYSPYIELSPILIPVADSGGTFELSISANCSWVIAYPDLVSSYSTTAGTGNRTITFSVPSTTADTTLVGNIVVTDESGQVSRTAKIEQYGSGAHIGIFPVELYFDSTGGSKTFSVTADCAYNVSMSSGGTWARVTPNSGYTGQTTFTVTVDSGYTGDTQRSTAVLIDAPGTGGLVAVYQNKPETRLIVGYYVTSTTEPTAILGSNGVSDIAKAEYPDGTEITPATAYTFPATGMQYVYYTLSGATVPYAMLDGLAYPALSGTVKTVIIPNGVTGVSDYSFWQLSGLTSVTLPDTLQVLGANSFNSCTSLSSITLPNSLTSIGSGCFRGCTSLSSITIPSGVTAIGISCFTGSSVSSFTFNSLTPPTLGSANALSSSTLSEIIVPCPAVNDYITAWPQYAQYISCSETGTTLYFVTDTSNVKGIGETRTITILNNSINSNSIGLNFPAGSYTVSGNVIYVTYPQNPSSSSSRSWSIQIYAQTTGGTSLSGGYTIVQNPYLVETISYTADTGPVDISGETRTITIDTSGLVESSITIGIEGATGVTYSYSNGVITIVFPAYTGGTRYITVTISADTTNGDLAYTTITYMQRETQNLKNYLTFNITSAGVINWQSYSNSYDTRPASAYYKTIEYRKNGGDWKTITSRSYGTKISVVAGDIVQFRGDNTSYGHISYADSGDRTNAVASSYFIGTTAGLTIEGNIMSLISSTNFSGLTTLSGIANFAEMFFSLSGLTDASNLVLPATELTNACYYGLFMACPNLTGAPELPAVVMKPGCYYWMFDRSGLPVAPELPATTLAKQCYYGMFRQCPIVTAPELPATTMEISCYDDMFYECDKLVTPPNLPATELANFCYYRMFKGCTSLTTAPELPATTLFDRCYLGMFSNCTSLRTAPVLPALVVPSSGYCAMFEGCTNLNYIKCLATNTSATDATGGWVTDVASSGTFVKNPAKSWSRGTSGIPSGWTIRNAT